LEKKKNGKKAEIKGELRGGKTTPLTAPFNLVVEVRLVDTENQGKGI